MLSIARADKHCLLGSSCLLAELLPAEGATGVAGCPVAFRDADFRVA